MYVLCTPCRKHTRARTQCVACICKELVRMRPRAHAHSAHAEAMRSVGGPPPGPWTAARSPAPPGAWAARLAAPLPRCCANEAGMRRLLAGACEMLAPGVPPSCCAVRRGSSAAALLGAPAPAAAARSAGCSGGAAAGTGKSAACGEAVTRPASSSSSPRECLHALSPSAALQQQLSARPAAAGGPLVVPRASAASRADTL